MTARLLRHGFEDVDVHHAPFEETILPDDGFDLVISNPPYGSQGVHDAEYLRAGKGHLTRSLHNYFAAKGLDKVRPGGIVAYVTSHYMLDSPRAESVRATLAEEADLLGAVRLPTGAFPDTKVVTDIVFLRKRLPDEAPGGHEWVKTEHVELDGTQQPVNSYFVDNPAQVLGTQATVQHGMRQELEYTVLPDSSIPVATALAGATESALRGAPDVAPGAPPSRPGPVYGSKGHGPEGAAGIRRLAQEFDGGARGGQAAGGPGERGSCRCGGRGKPRGASGSIPGPYRKARRAELSRQPRHHGGRRRPGAALCTGELRQSIRLLEAPRAYWANG